MPPPHAGLRGGGVGAGLTGAYQLAFHIDNLLEVSHATRADMLSTAHGFHKAGVVLGIQLFDRADDFGFKVSRQRVADQIGPLGISGDCQMIRICFIRSG